MKFWTEERNAIVREKYPRCATADIAAELGAASPGAVKDQARRLGVQKEKGFRAHKRPLSGLVLEALEDGPMPLAQLARAVGRSTADTYGAVRRLFKSGELHRAASGKYAIGPAPEPVAVVLPSWVCPPVPAFRGVVRAVHTCRGEE